MIRSVRSFFEKEGFLEVQTPLLTRAPAPEPHINPVAVADGRFLGASPELHMKRMLAAGFDKIFQVTSAFRDAERGRLHHPEFTILEWYRLGANYKDLQQDCQNMLRSVSDALGISRLLRNGVRLEAAGDWQRVTVREAFSRFAGWEPDAGFDQTRFDVDMVTKIEPNLGFPSPCILEDYPASRAALARLKPDNPLVAERFELYWAGMELANGFSELVDKAEQRARFEAVRDMRQAAGLKTGPMPEAFLSSLDRLPPCAGIAFGVDRLAMLLCGADSIDSVIAFTVEDE